MAPADKGSKMGTSAQDVEKLLASGIEIPDDPVEIEKLLAGVEPGEATQDNTKVADEAKAKADADAAEKKAADEKAIEDAKAKDAEAVKKADADASENVPGAVLRTTREALHTTEDTLAERDKDLATERQKNVDLEAKLAAAQVSTEKTQEELQAQADEASKGKVNLETITPEEIEALRSTLDDDAVDLIAKLAANNATLTEKLSVIETQALDVAKREENLIREQQQGDIDSVPLLAVLQVDRGEGSPERWARVVQYEDALKTDPDWQGKSQREYYAEVGRRMEAYLGEEQVKGLLAGETPTPDPAKVVEEPKKPEVVEEELSAAAAGVPGSLSDVPTAGSAVAQDEQERAEAMSLSDAERVLGAAADVGPDEVNKQLSRLLTPPT